LLFIPAIVIIIIIDLIDCFATSPDDTIGTCPGADGEKRMHKPAYPDFQISKHINVGKNLRLEKMDLDGSMNGKR